MLGALKLYLDIVLLRRGPEDVPVSQSLLLSTIAVFAALNVTLRLAFPPATAIWPAALATSIAFTLAWYFLLLRLAGHPERWLQVVAAVFGVGCLLTPLLAPLEAVLGQYVDKPDQTPGWILLVLPLALYVLYVNARIVRAAIGQPMALCVVLIVLQWLLEALVVSTVVGPAAAPAVAPGT
jgi:hypothetical protein